MIHINFPGVSVKISDGLTTSTFNDGSGLHAMSQDNEEYRQRARDLGYGEDGDRMSREHELLHHMLAVWLQLPNSPALLDAAHDRPKSIVAGCEEGVVLALQRFCNAAGVDVMSLVKWRLKIT